MGLYCEVWLTARYIYGGGAIMFLEINELPKPAGLVLMRCSIVQLESGSLSFRSFIAAFSVLILSGAVVSFLRSRILSFWLWARLLATCSFACLFRIKEMGTYLCDFVASAVAPAGSKMLLGGLVSRLAGLAAVAAASH